MDRKAGYKECPRCGLRNKPSALQCDFCGLRFIAVEEWDDNITDLEKMGGNEEKVLVDEDVSKRIEATIVKRDKIDAPVKAKEPENEFDYFRKEPGPAHSEPLPVVATSIEAAPTTVVEPIPGPAQAIQDSEEVAPTSSAETLTVPTPIVSATVTPVPERIVMYDTPEPARVATAPVKEKTKERCVARPTDEFSTKKSTSNHTIVFSALLALGALGYLAAIIYGTDAVGRIGSWALVTVATIMMVIGAGGLFKSRAQTQAALDESGNAVKPQNVLICPNCHELVNATDRSCPDCGAEFGASE
jgi:RNA polymerase subunit RPABC4/transcription elongation factor Spt4